MTETKLLTGGIDTDSAPHLIEDGAVLNMVNARAVLHKEQATGEVRFLEGNVEDTSFVQKLPAGTNTLIGKCNDGRYAYFLFHNATESVIAWTDTAQNTNGIFFRESWVTGGLNWNAAMYADCSVANGVLYVADGVNETRYFNTDTNYFLQAPMVQDRINLITEPPVIPIQASRNTTVQGSPALQYKSVQFSYRFTTEDDFISVLAPYSAVCAAPWATEIDNNPLYGSSIDLTVDVEQRIPINWRLLELIVRYPESNSFFVIKRYDRTNSADMAAIIQHNNGTPLSYNWKGEDLYAIATDVAVKPFESIPLRSDRLLLGDNRLFLAGNLEGYDMNTEWGNAVSVSPQYSQVPVNQTIEYTGYCYVVSVGDDPNGQNNPVKDFYGACVIQWNNKIYLLPNPYSRRHTIYKVTNLSSTSSVGGHTVDDDYPVWQAPAFISESTLVELDLDGNDPVLGTEDLANIPNNATRTQALQARASIVEQAFKTSFSGYNLSWNAKSYIGKQISIVSSTNILIRGFLPDTEYKYGLQLYDSYLRKCGVVEAGSFTPDALEIAAVSASSLYKVCTKVDISINPAMIPTLPAWVKHYSIVMSKQQRSALFMQWTASIVKVALKNKEGVIFRGYGELTAPPGGYEYYGLAIPIADVAAYNYGYTYQEGDVMELSGMVALGFLNVQPLTISGIVKDTVGGHIIIGVTMTDALKGGYMIANFIGMPYLNLFNRGNNISYTHPVVCTLYQSTGAADIELYEVGKFGKVANGVLDNFYDTGSLTTTVKGDCYLQKRDSAAGAVRCLSYKPNERSASIIPVTDTGRIAPKDTIGQKYLPTATRWSNTYLPGTDTNGYARFDATDYKVIEETVGSIQSLQLTTKGVQEGALMLLLCEKGSYATLLGKRQVFGTDQNSAFTTSAGVMGEINPVKDGYGCQSPRSVITHEGRIFWLDYNRRSILEYSSDGGVKVVSQFKASRLWDKLLGRIAPPNPELISCGLNPYSRELMVSVSAALLPAKGTLPTTNLPDPFDAYYNGVRTYLYNYELKRWVGSYEADTEYMNVGSFLLGWNKTTGKLYKEFSHTPGQYYGLPAVAVIGLSFTKDYPAVKKPYALRLDANRAPDAAYIVADGMEQGVGVAVPMEWKRREGTWYAAISRDRLSRNATNAATWAAAGISGTRLTGKAIKIALLWDAAAGEMVLRSATLLYDTASGQ